MEAGVGFEPTMHLAYETGVVTALPAIEKIGRTGEIWTHDFTVLQTVAFDLSATVRHTIMYNKILAVCGGIEPP